MSSDRDSTKGDWQAVCCPLDVPEPATAADISPEVNENSR